MEWSSDDKRSLSVSDPETNPLSESEWVKETCDGEGESPSLGEEGVCARVSFVKGICRRDTDIDLVVVRELVVVIAASLSNTLRFRSANVRARVRAPLLFAEDRETALPDDPVPIDRLSSDIRAVWSSLYSFGKSCTSSRSSSSS